MNERPPLPTATAIRVLLMMALRRWLERVPGQMGAAFRRKSATGRTATAPKRRPGFVRTAVVVVLFLFIGVNAASGVVRTLAESITPSADGPLVVERYTYRKIERAAETIALADETERAEVAARQRSKLARWLAEDALGREVSKEDPLSALPSDKRAEIARVLDTFDRHGIDGFRKHELDAFLPDYPWVANSGEFRALFALVLYLSFACVLLMSLGNANTDLGQVDWTMQWLFTFPVRARSLFVAKVIEYTLVNTASWIIHLTLFFTSMWSIGYRASAVVIALAATLYVNILVALARVLLETWLRKHARFEHLKNIQAACTALGTLTMLALYALSYRHLPFKLTALTSVPDVIGWLPLALPAMLVAGGTTSIVAGALMVVGAAGLVTIVVRVAERLVRDGLVVGGGTRTGQRGAPSTSASGWFRGVVDRELVLLRRDRNLLLQTVIVPILVLGFQILISPQMFEGAIADSRQASAITFAVGVFVLMGGGFMALSNEGKALWLLYTFPQRIEYVLFRKAIVWGAIALLYSLATLVIIAVLAGGFDVDGMIGGITALVGVAIYTFIAVPMGALGTDPLAEEVHRKARPTVVYAYMLLAGMYGYGLYAPHWTKLVLAIVCSLLAVAMWQVVRDRAPLLLDPVQQPPPRIGLSDGLVAVLAFLVLQTVVGGIALKAGASGLAVLLIAFVVAGGLVTLLALLVFWRRKVPDILVTVGLRAPTAAASLLASIGVGIAMGAGAGSIGVVYQRLVGFEATPIPTAVVVLAVAAAPIFEELIFRGLVFRGLRRSFSPSFAIGASAAIFAIVHPPGSVPVVFVLGVAAAWSFHRTGRLVAAICAHAVYNAIVLFAPLS